MGFDENYFWTKTGFCRLTETVASKSNQLIGLVRPQIGV